MSNNDAITRAQIALIVQAEMDENYPIEKHIEDAELIADLTEQKLRKKYESEGADDDTL